MVKAVLGQDVATRGATKETAESDGQIEEKDITSELDFADWYNGLEHDLLDSSHDDYTSVALRQFRNEHAEDIYRNYKRQLELSQSHLDTLLSDTSSTLDLLASLTSSFKEVEEQTTIFQRQCAGLQHEQARITRLADHLDDNLKYYNYLEPVTRRLNAPGAGNFVRSKEFSDMLARIDECLEYMAAHVSGVLRETDRYALG